MPDAEKTVNPLLNTDGLPAFSQIRPEHVRPAVTRILAENRARLTELLSGASPRSFENLVEPIERMQHRLSRVWSPVGHLNAVINSAELRDVYNECLPLISEYHTELGQNEALYGAYDTLAKDEAVADDPVRLQVLNHGLRDFRLAGVALEGAQKARFSQIMQDLAALQAKYEQNLLDATDAWQHHCDDPAGVAGLPAQILEPARQAAAQAGLEGWLFNLDQPTYQAVVTHANDRGLRQTFYRAWSTRASDRGPHDAGWDNTDTMEAILALRHEAAQTLSFDNFAEYSLATKMAASVDEVLAFLGELIDKSLPVARREMEELERFAGRDLEAWDIAYYAEQLRRDRLQISDEELRPYFPLEQVLDGMFGVAQSLFALKIETDQLEHPWHNDVRLFRIVDDEGQVLGRFYIDLFARANKRSGAWMDECVIRKRLGGEFESPVAHLVCNFLPGIGQQPAMLTHTDVVTLFHEFGHTLHHLMTRVDYPSLAGINGVAWDAVELPSQFMENFAWRREVLPLISRHYQTGEPLPESLFSRLSQSRTFHAGMQMVRQLEFALFDFRIHAEYAPGNRSTISTILEKVRERLAVFPVPEFNRFAHSFAHIFGGSYAAGYYSYKWAEVLAADAFGAFQQAGVFDRPTASRFRRSILECGGSREAMDLFVAFRGRAPQVDALLAQAGMA